MHEIKDLFSVQSILKIADEFISLKNKIKIITDQSCSHNIKTRQLEQINVTKNLFYHLISLGIKYKIKEGSGIVTGKFNEISG